MASGIPSWVVSVVGAIIVIAATVLSSTSLQETRRLIAEKRSEITTRQQEVDALWNSHRQADERATAADILYAGTLGEDSKKSFLLRLITEHIQGAVLSMYAASRHSEEVPDASPEDIMILLGELPKGNHKVYLGLKLKINELRFESVGFINKLSDGIRSAESRLRILEAQESRIYFTHVAFNVFGLIVVMCKDLPVWKKQQAPRQE